MTQPLRGRDDRSYNTPIKYATAYDRRVINLLLFSGKSKMCTSDQCRIRILLDSKNFVDTFQSLHFRGLSHCCAQRLELI